VPNSAPQWGWSCGFYPGSEPGDHRSGVAETFDGARAGFEAAWQKLSATRSETDYEAWRRERDWTAWKDCMHRLALALPTQRPDGIARCFCGEMVTTRTLVGTSAQHTILPPPENAAQHIAFGRPFFARMRSCSNDLRAGMRRSPTLGKVCSRLGGFRLGVARELGFDARLWEWFRS
jgi:hypothetical protein